MIYLDHITYFYPDQATPALADFSVEIEPGEFVLVVGPSGAGKSTFLRSLNGLVPHFYGGRWAGRAEIFGRDPVAVAPRGMADLVGFVFQDPEAQFVVDTVEDELSFAMENFALPQTTMRKRVEEVLDQMNIAHLRNRRISTLSGGEKQRVAIAAVLALQPELLVLDEPTSQLDPQAAEEVLIALRHLNEDLGLTVILSEHRLERVVQYADRVLYLPGLGLPPVLDEPRAVMAQVPLVPPLIELGRTLGWRPLPLTIKEGRKHARRLTGQINQEIRGQRVPQPRAQASAGSEPVEGQRAPQPRAQASAGPEPVEGQRAPQPQAQASAGPEPVEGQRVPQPQAQASAGPEPVEGQRATLSPPHPGSPALVIKDLRYAYDGHAALRGVSLKVRSGEFVALMGRNGSGKSTLLKQIVGVLKPDEGHVTVMGLDTRRTAVDEIIRYVGYVPQHPGALLFQETLAGELAFTRRGHRLPPDPVGDEILLDRLGLGGLAQRDPRDLSGGEQQRAALAAILVANPQVILLDEPTRGLDYVQKKTLADLLLSLRQEGRTIVMATHDVELVATCADRVVLLAEGEVVVDGPAREVMSDSQVFSSQINKLFRDPRFLVVEDVLQALANQQIGKSIDQQSPDAC